MNKFKIFLSISVFIGTVVLGYFIMKWLKTSRSNEVKNSAPEDFEEGQNLRPNIIIDPELITAMRPQQTINEGKVTNAPVNSEELYIINDLND